MSAAFDREALLDAFDDIGRAAVQAGTKLQIAVWGSALMPASNFRFATEDADIADIGQQWPEWLSSAVERVSTKNGWSSTWLNNAVSFHLSPLAQVDRDLMAFGSFPRRSEHVGLVVFIPTARYMLALKLKALRISDFEKGQQDMHDVAHLLKALNLTDMEQAIGILAEFFPKSASDADKQRFVLKRLLSEGTAIDPTTLAQAAERVVAGQPLDKALPEFLDEFYLAQTSAQQDAMLADEPPSMGDQRLDGLFGAVAEYLAHQSGLPRVPSWAYSPARYLDHAWHASSIGDAGMREYLTFVSPGEFASRNIFTEERPLRRARGPRPTGT